MRRILGTLLGALLAMALLGCSGDDAGTSPTKVSAAAPDEVADLDPLWSVDLLVPPNGTGGVDAVSQRHFIGAGSMDNSPGTTNPMPNVPLAYGIGDAETGAVASVAPLNNMPGTVEAIPGTDLFVAVAPSGWKLSKFGQPQVTGYTVGVVDPATASFLWKRRAVGTEVVGMSSTRIYMGRDNRSLAPICRRVADGGITHDAACRAAVWGPDTEVDGVRLSSTTRIVDLPGGEQITVPVTQAHGADGADLLWTQGDTSTSFGDGEIGYATSTFLASDLGLIRVDYSFRGKDPQAQVNSPVGRAWPDAVLRLLDPQTGAVTRTLGRVRSGTLSGVAGDIAIFQHEGATGVKAAGYRLDP